MSTASTKPIPHRTASDGVLRHRPTVVRPRKRMRRMSTSAVGRSPRAQLRQPLPHSLEALDLSSNSPTQSLASLRFLVLSYLADLEARLADYESPDLMSLGGATLEEMREWASTALDKLESIRQDVSAALPEFHLSESLAARLPDMTMPTLGGLPDFPSLDDVRNHLPDSDDLSQRLRSKLDDVRAALGDIDISQPSSFLPTLPHRIQDLQTHLSEMQRRAGIPAPSAMLYDLLDALRSSEVVCTLIRMAEEEEERVEDMVESAAREVRKAVKRSLEGMRLIQYSELPEGWRNNPFVTHGYRFIPLERWHLIVLSLFAFHNETLNIHTHLIPALLWGINSIPFLHGNLPDLPERIFMSFALLCLFSSAVWHTMSGCAHFASMEFCARIDYVGIGWLISASVGTVVYYGFQDPQYFGIRNSFLSLCFLTGLAGNIFPFMQWFNEYKYRGYRILFFLTLAFSSLAPLAVLTQLYSFGAMMSFVRPIVPSLLSYVAGLVFYATHLPERWLSPKWSQRLDCIGGGSHCIWHLFIVLAVSQHRGAIGQLKQGIEGLRL
ncbi:hemolysin-III related-domain-containing protein [Schizophyllum amplum]|uniref:Hemolysin-III related-domain-containing protein n=1 Tax=Schizophyllum amplum TaxID=97359 RepID=A0A550C3F7_9AGAR|nr:hemolysin-III related-domain-containing protein [Auriculariopsis ampla]